MRHDGAFAPALSAPICRGMTRPHLTFRRAAIAALFAIGLAGSSHAADLPEALTAEEALAIWAEAPGTVFASGQIELGELQYLVRPLLVFADSPHDPNFVEEMRLIEERVTDLEVRDVMIITDTEPDGDSPLRLELRPRGFSLVLIGKDGAIAFRKPAPWDTREISRAIDKLPLRIQEIRDGG